MQAIPFVCPRRPVISRGFVIPALPATHPLRAHVYQQHEHQRVSHLQHHRRRKHQHGLSQQVRDEPPVDAHVVSPLRAQQVAQPADSLHRSRFVRLPGKPVDHVVAQRRHVHQVQPQHGKAHHHEEKPVAIALTARTCQGETHHQVVHRHGHHIDRQRGQRLRNAKADEQVEQYNLNEVVRRVAQPEAHEPLHRSAYPEGELRRKAIIAQEAHHIAHGERRVVAHIGKEHIVDGIMDGRGQQAHHHETAHLFHALIIHNSLQSYS